MIHMNFVQIADFDWLPWPLKGKFLKKIFKNLLLKSHKGMKLKLCIHVHDISLYIVFFIVIAHMLLLLWQLKVSIDL